MREFSPMYACGFAAGFCGCPPMPPPCRMVSEFFGETRASVKNRKDHQEWSAGWSDGLAERKNSRLVNQTFVTTNRLTEDQRNAQAEGIVRRAAGSRQWG